MSLRAGSHLGPYEIRSLLGAGGMGEVYRARDPRLDRDVAIKALIAEDPEFRARFEQEARAVAALNHPNIVAVYDFGGDYIVSELVEGKTLREAGPQPLRRALEIAAQIADGLAAAHSVGIIHRDIKPENIMLTRDGRARILDFGIAKRAQTGASNIAHTQAGFVLGTAAYMSPEQIRGDALDGRSDLFSLGLVLHEMLTGSRAFQRGSTAEVLGAILRDDPPPLPPSTPPAVATVVRQCLEKDPELRFGSARDLAIILRALAGDTHATSARTDEAAQRPRKRARAVAAVAILVAFALSGFVAGRLRTASPELPVYRQLTFHRGHVSAGRFTSGSEIVLSAQRDRETLDVFATDAESPESRSLNLRGAHLFAVSRRNELAVALDARFVGDNNQSGMLAIVPLHGGSPRRLLADVTQADWDAAGSDLAIVRSVNGADRLEYPLGKVLYETSGWIGDLRFSPAGDRLAFSEHMLDNDDRGVIAMVDLSGKKTTLSREWESVEGLAWNGDEIWYAASSSGLANTLLAVTRAGSERVIGRYPGGIHLEDIAADGRVLLIRADDDRAEMFVRVRGESRDRPLDWMGSSFPVQLSEDGGAVLFSQYGSAGGGNYVAYLWKLEEREPVRLGEGDAACLSRDGMWALAVLNTQPQQLVQLPIAAGSVRPIDHAGLILQQEARWLADSQRLIANANKPGERTRLWVLSLDGHQPQSVSGEGVRMEGDALSPAGDVVAARAADGAAALYSIAGGSPKPLPGFTAADSFVRWRPNGKQVLIRSGARIPASLFELDTVTGERKPWMDLSPADPTGITEITQVLVDAEGRTVVYGQNRRIRTLYLAEGLAAARR